MNDSRSNAGGGASKLKLDHARFGSLSFSAIVFVAVATVLSVHFILFHKTNFPSVPPDATFSPESCMYVGVAVALCLMGMLMYHERRTR